jgi:hypothetical protein
MSIIAKSVIFDIADNYINDFINIRSIDFLLAGVLLEPQTIGYSARNTTNYVNSTHALYAFDTSLPKTGASASVSWLSGRSYDTNQRLIIVFDSPVEFDTIVINNGHESGGTTTRGAKNVVITSSTDTITSTVYNDVITNPTVLFTGVLDEHVAADVEDPQTVYQAPIFRGNFISPLASMESYGEVANSLHIAAPLVALESYGEVANSVSIVTPLASISCEVYFYSGSTEIVSVPANISATGDVSIVGHGVIAPRQPSVSCFGDVNIMGAGHIVTKAPNIHGDYGAVGNVEVSAKVDSYGKVSVIGYGVVDARPVVVSITGQLSLLATVSYVVKPPAVISTGIVYPTGYGAISVPSPSVFGYGYIRSTGVVEVPVKLPQIVCHAKQADDYTVIRHIREGTCH